jgi:hypothetical protein
MLNSRTPFLLGVNKGVPVVSIGAGDVPLGRLPPFLPIWTRGREWRGDPYPDAFRLPSLPLPLLMRVAKFNRRMAFPRQTPVPLTYRITGITRDSVGAILGNCEVHLFRTADDVELDQVTSNANGEFTLTVGIAPTRTYYIVAYKAGGTDVAGTTLNTLTGL